MAVAENKFPKISILLPTLNAERVLEKCLKSIFIQDYPKGKIEVIIADGGSTDRTLAIAGKFKTKICHNPLKTGEAGKAIALKMAKGDLTALIDSDNILPINNWLKRMIEPFFDQQIVGSEPWEFNYRKTDFYLNRYCALTGVNDPYCYFVGNYDKKSALSGKWTDLKLDQEDKNNYLKVKIRGKILPTIGANGTLWRTEILKRAVGEKDYLFDTDIPYVLLESRVDFYFAKVKIGIIHNYCRKFSDFVRKQDRRAKDFFYLEKQRQRSRTYQSQKTKQLSFILSTVFILPLLFQSLKGFFKKRDWVWFLHPLLCIITLYVYTKETILAKFKVGQRERKGWSQ